MKNSILMSILIVFSSCQTQVNAPIGTVADTIFVSYHPGIIDYNTFKSCRDLVSWADALTYIHDTIAIGRKDYDAIASLVKGEHHVVSDDTYQPDVCVQMGDSCIGLLTGDVEGFYSCNIDSRIFKDDPKIVYRIMCLAGYFNCFERDWIAEYPLIKKYGFPSDYKFSHKRKEYEEVEIEDGVYEILNYDEEEEEREWGFRKVALVLDETK